MTVAFTLAARTNVSSFKDTANKGDVTRYSIDCTPWAEDSGAVVSALSTIKYGSASITNETLVNGVWSADITFTARQRVKLGILISTATAKKQAYINIEVNDPSTCGDDYGQNCC